MIYVIVGFVVAGWLLSIKRSSQETAENTRNIDLPEHVKRERWERSFRKLEEDWWWEEKRKIEERKLIK
jgi:hypothetical protein